MAARHRALARLHRHVPNVTGPDTRPLAARLSDRDEDAQVGLTLGGESLHTRTEVHERSLRGPKAGPNAPLLIRLVRYPYGIRPVRFGRRAGTERPNPGEPRAGVATESVRSILDEGHLNLPGSPTERIHAEAPPRPFRRRDPSEHDDTVPVGLP